jgi:hypothetical protein
MKYEWLFLLLLLLLALLTPLAHADVGLDATAYLTVGVLTEDGQLRVSGGTLALYRNGAWVMDKSNTGYTGFDTRVSGRYCVRLTPPEGWEAVEQVVCDDGATGHATIHVRPVRATATPTATVGPSATATATRTPGVTPSPTATRTATPTIKPTLTSTWVEPTLDPAIWPPCLVRVWNGQTVVYEGLGDHIEVVR